MILNLSLIDRNGWKK